MIQRKAAGAALLFCAAMLPALVHAQVTGPRSPLSTRPNSTAQGAPAARPNAARPQALQPETATPNSAGNQTGNEAGNQTGNPTAGQCEGDSCDVQPQHISIATAAPAPSPWTWQERVTWASNLVLVLLGYVAILMALALLRKIERQSRFFEETAQAAVDSARAALAQAEAFTRAERPWILMNVRPSQSIENGFTVVATNRGRGPARVLRIVDDVAIAVDEERLPATPGYRKEPVSPADPMILLPGESTEIAAFSRDDVQRVAESREQLERIEKWEEKIFLFGTLVYRDLTSPEEATAYESSWFCWYIHGRQKSGMVMAGPPAYNKHS